ncbi:hypothetical protein V1478_002497 [Vespula squamosa]|uniref:Uncharacterized protein n=1 Tax=Vespula squamosa TaxID=30214 RepID=A0ABD2BU76_VESSQ
MEVKEEEKDRRKKKKEKRNDVDGGIGQRVHSLPRIEVLNGDLCGTSNAGTPLLDYSFDVRSETRRLLLSHTDLRSPIHPFSLPTIIPL